jgi:hypothetical protein
MRAVPLGRLKRFSRNDWRVLGIGQLECVSYDVVCGMFYCIDIEEVLINEDDRHDCELCRLVVEIHPTRFLDGFSPKFYARHSNYFMPFMCLFIECLIQ